MLRNTAETLLFAEVFDHTLVVHTSKRTATFRGTLKDFCKEYENCGFYRIHKSYGVNINAVKSASQKGVVLTDGTELPVRKGGVKSLKFHLKNRIFSLLLKENMVK